MSRTVRCILLIVGCLTFAQLQAQTPSAADVQRVTGIISKMTLEQKIDYIGGTGFAIRPMPALGLPSWEMSDDRTRDLYRKDARAALAPVLTRLEALADEHAGFTVNNPVTNTIRAFVREAGQ